MGVDERVESKVGGTQWTPSMEANHEVNGQGISNDGWSVALFISLLGATMPCAVIQPFDLNIS